jgi:hypothetical protein
LSHALKLRGPLPMLPPWLAQELCVPLDREQSYEPGCAEFYSIWMMASRANQPTGRKLPGAFRNPGTFSALWRSRCGHFRSSSPHIPSALIAFAVAMYVMKLKLPR